MNHDELASDLAAHLRGVSKRITWENMQLGESGSPRPDVYTMEPTYTRLTFEAFECKVSVSDFRRDVTAGKWQSYLRYANSVTFAVPQGLVNKDDVPSTCGLIVRGSTGLWRYAKKPTRQVLTDLPYQAWIKLLLNGVERASITRRAAGFNEYRAGKALAKKFGEEVAKMVCDIQGLPQRLEYERANHEAMAKVWADQRQAEQARVTEQRAAAEQRCSGAVAKLACALGLAPDALLSDLQGRAQQLLTVLDTARSQWDQHPLLKMADRMETLAKDMRQAGEVLSKSRVDESAVV